MCNSLPTEYIIVAHVILKIINNKRRKKEEKEKKKTNLVSISMLLKIVSSGKKIEHRYL